MDFYRASINYELWRVSSHRIYKRASDNVSPSLHLRKFRAATELQPCIPYSNLHVGWKMVSANFCCRSSSSKPQQRLGDVTLRLFSNIAKLVTSHLVWWVNQVCIVFSSVNRISALLYSEQQTFIHFYLPTFAFTAVFHNRIPSKNSWGPQKQNQIVFF